ncbi:MAG: hypothetical protein EWV49_06130 [Microcystis aeruginosa Ma_QC_Ch_20071001_S25]|nr:MAG: hypothetical protein EWV49_06130 [Microcystis aeruginosa Ma_QC_Ch_20071001_S25]
MESRSRFHCTRILNLAVSLISYRLSVISYQMRVFSSLITVYCLLITEQPPLPVNLLRSGRVSLKIFGVSKQ